MFKKNETDKGIELIYDVGKNDRIDNVSIGMMRNNDIPGLFPIDIITNDTNIEFKYKLGQVKNLNEYLEEDLTKNDLLNIFENICKAISCIEEYMLRDTQVLLENDYIFIKDDTLRLILLPVYDRRSSISMPVFFKNLLLDMMVKNEYAAYFASDITRQLTEEESFSYDKFLELISALKLKKHIEKPGIKKPAISSEAKERRVNNIENSLKPRYLGVDYQGYSDTKYNNSGYNNTNHNKKYNNNILTNFDIQNSNKILNQNPSQDTQINTINPAKEGKKKGLFCFGKSEKKKEEKQVSTSSFQTNNSFLIPGRDEPVNVGVQEKQKKEKKKFSLFGKKKEKEVVQKDNNISPTIPVGGNFGETTVLQQNPINPGETTLLNFFPTTLSSFLIWIRTGEKIFINKSNFRIGREKNYVDFCIIGNTSVGRNHAEIIQKDGSFFIRDLKSLNFTMVNGEKISPNLEVELWDNDIISLANEEFEFHIG